MPYSVRKIPNKNCYKVYNQKTKKVFSKCSSKKNATKQMRLLRALQYNKDFVPNTQKQKQQQKKNRTRKNK